MKKFPFLESVKLEHFHRGILTSNAAARHSNLIFGYFGIRNVSLLDSGIHSGDDFLLESWPDFQDP